MAAVAPPQRVAFPQKSNHNETPDYVNAQFNQHLAHPTKHSANSLSSGQDSKVQENSHERRLINSYPDHESSRSLVKSVSEIDGDGPSKIQWENIDDDQSTIAVRPRGHLQRANTDPRPRRPSPTTAREIHEENWELRHGWEDQYNSSEYLGLLSSVSTR